MIPNNTAVYDVESNIVADEHDLGISNDPRVMQQIINMLTDLYSDPIKASVREIVTNAIDATIMAGSTRPVQIESPGGFNTVFSVRDFGVGLSRDEIIKHFIMYGESTKRETNDAAGMMGIGCKSPLAYTDSYTVTGIKDGMRTDVIIARTDFGGAKANIVAHESTYEPNGVCVSWSVKSADNGSFYNASENMARASSFPVEVNGKAYDPDFTAGDGKIRVFVDAPARNYVVMGNVPYPAEYLRNINCSVYYDVPMGAVDFTPSRDQLLYNDKTKNVIDRLSDIDISDDVTDFMQKYLEDCSSMLEAMDTQRSLLSKLGFAGNSPIKCTYDGLKIPINHFGFDQDIDLRDDDVKLLKYGKAKVLNKDIFASGAVQGWYVKVTDLPAKTNKSIIKRYADRKGYQLVIIKSPKWDYDKFIDHVSYAEVLKWERERVKETRPAKTANNNTTLKYDCLSSAGTAYRNIDGFQNIYYRTNRSASPLRPLKDDECVVTLEERREDKFHRLYPQAKSITEFNREVVDDPDAIESMKFAGVNVYYTVRPPASLNPHFMRYDYCAEEVLRLASGKLKDDQKFVDAVVSKLKKDIEVAEKLVMRYPRYLRLEMQSGASKFIESGEDYFKENK